MSTAPAECLPGPRCCDQAGINEIEPLVAQIEAQWPGRRIIKERSTELEEALDRAWARTLQAINGEVCGNTGHNLKTTNDGQDVLMGQATEFRKTPLRQHLGKQAAQSTREHVSWEFLYRRFVEARAWCTKGSKALARDDWTKRHWVPWYKELKRRCRIAVKDKVLSQEEWGTILTSTWCRQWKTTRTRFPSVGGPGQDLHGGDSHGGGTEQPGRLGSEGQGRI